MIFVLEAEDYSLQYLDKGIDSLDALLYFSGVNTGPAEPIFLCFFSSHANMTFLGLICAFSGFPCNMGGCGVPPNYSELLFCGHPPKAGWRPFGLLSPPGVQAASANAAYNFIISCTCGKRKSIFQASAGIWSWQNGESGGCALPDSPFRAVRSSPYHPPRSRSAFHRCSHRASG